MWPALLMVALSGDGELVWDAPPGCPTAHDVEAGIQRLLAEEAAPRVPAEGRIAVRGSGYELTVTVANETRVVAADACEPLGAVAALVIAVAHDPVAVAATIPDRAATIDEVAPDEEVVPPREETSAKSAGPVVEVRKSPPRRDRPVRAGVMPFIAVGGGELPGVGVGFGLGVATFGRRWWRVELAGGGWLPRRADAPDNPEYGADLWMVGGSVRGCGVPRAGAVEFPICGGAELDAWVARARGPALTNPTEPAQLYVAAVASAGVIVPLRPWLALAARAELLVSLRSPAVRIDGVGFVFRAQPVAGRLVLGPEFRFP